MFLCVWDLGGDVTCLMGVVVIVLLLWCCFLWVLCCVVLGAVVVRFLNEFQFAIAFGCGIVMFLCDVVGGCA